MPSSALSLISRHFQYAWSISCSARSRALMRGSSLRSERNDSFWICFPGGHQLLPYSFSSPTPDITECVEKSRKRPKKIPKTHPDLLQEPVLLPHLFRHFLPQFLVLVERLVKDPLEPFGLDVACASVGEAGSLFEHFGADIICRGNLAAVGDDPCPMGYTVIELFERGAEGSYRRWERGETRR